jgi:hypothetical protein
MKKTGLVFLLLTGAALLGAQTAVIREINGTVEVKNPGAPEWETAKAGQLLYPASLISTGFKSTALLGIGNSDITVRSLTRLSLEEILAAQNGERITLNLRAGRIRADVRPPAGGTINFTVQSPMATAAVRGTIFDFDGIRLQVEDGRVYLWGSNALGVYISAGHATAVEETLGKIATAIETIKEELNPALPAGVDTVPAAISSTPPSANLDVERAGEQNPKNRRIQPPPKLHIVKRPYFHLAPKPRNTHPVPYSEPCLTPSLGP